MLQGFPNLAIVARTAQLFFPWQAATTPLRDTSVVESTANHKQRFLVQRLIPRGKHRNLTLWHRLCTTKTRHKLRP